MENSKIVAKTKEESEEIQKILFDLGFVWAFNKKPQIQNIIGRINIREDKTLTTGMVFYGYEVKEITIEQLEDMVVLKRNDVGDATHENYKTNSDYYVSSDNVVYFFDDEKTNTWKLSNYLLDELTPIKKEKTMNEYLFKYNGQYTLVELSKEDADSNPEQYIEVPEGAIALTKNEYNKMHFWKEDNFAFCIGRDNEFYKAACTIEDCIFNEGWDVLWRREKPQEKCDDICDAVSGNDVVSHPQHYCSHPSGIECIEMIKAGMSEEMFEGYLKGCCNKYLWRYKMKGGSESLRKAQWYLDRLIKLNEEIESRN